MLYKLSLSNLKKSFKDYAIYFVTLILGVCIFYIFNSLDSQSAMLNVSSRQNEMIDLLVQLLSYVSVFVSFVLGFLIIYASSFLIKKRNKEFGIYMTLGMSKRKISFLLLIETFFIGLISLAIGLMLGILLSQVTSIFIANMFEADMSKYTFNFSKLATIKTVIYFGIIYFIVMIFNTIIINKNKLINLLHSDKKHEKIKIKNSLVCIILFVISIGMLSTAYYMVSAGVDFLFGQEFKIILLPISLGIVGTLLFFYSFSGMVLKIVSKCHKLYYNKLNVFVFKQLSSKINTMVISVSIICIMLFFTLCLLSSAFAIKNFFNKSINTYSPVDFELVYYGSNDIDNDDPFKLFKEDKTVKNNTRDLITINQYYDSNFLYRDSLGSYYEVLKENYPYVDYSSLVEIVKVSDYNRLAKLFDMKTISLKSDQYAIVSNYNKELYDEALKTPSSINVFGNSLLPRYSESVDGFIHISANPSNVGFVVVSDEIVNEDADKKILLFGNYSTDNENIVKSIEEKINRIRNNDFISGDTKLDIKVASAGLKTIVTFIGLYLGIIFLISSSAILSLKELSDSIDDKNKYSILRQIGVDEKQINSALFKQTLIFFFLPLSLAIVHTIFGLKFCKYILSSLGIGSVISGAFPTFVFLIFIYGVYFGITYICSKNIIKD